jgi:hypothetical protein
MLSMERRAPGSTRSPYEEFEGIERWDFESALRYLRRAVLREVRDGRRSIAVERALNVANCMLGSPGELDIPDEANR